MKFTVKYNLSLCVDATLTITILDIINCPVYHLKYDVSETRFYLQLQVEPQTETSSFYTVHLSGLRLKTPVEWTTVPAPKSLRVIRGNRMGHPVPWIQLDQSLMRLAANLPQ
jgi:hypothetical protein